jgi:hypothetical protein
LLSAHGCVGKEYGARIVGLILCFPSPCHPPPPDAEAMSKR